MAKPTASNFLHSGVTARFGNQKVLEGAGTSRGFHAVKGPQGTAVFHTASEATSYTARAHGIEAAHKAAGRTVSDQPNGPVQSAQAHRAMAAQHGVHVSDTGYNYIKDPKTGLFEGRRKGKG